LVPRGGSGSFRRRLGKQDLIGCCLFAGRLEQAGIRIEATTVGKDIVPDAFLENALGFARRAGINGEVSKFGVVVRDLQRIDCRGEAVHV